MRGMEILLPAVLLGIEAGMVLVGAFSCSLLRIRELSWMLEAGKGCNTVRTCAAD